MIGKRLMRNGLALLCLVICCRVAAADTWLSDNFDSYANGSLSGQGGWGGGLGVIRVQTGFVESGKAAEGNCLLWGDGEVYHTVSAAAGYHYIDFDAAMDTACDTYGANLGFIKFYSSTGVEITRFYYGHQQFKVLLGPANQFPVLENTGNRVWHHIRLGIDLVNSTMDVWVNDVQKVAGGATYHSANNIGIIEVGQWDCTSYFTKTETYVDNLVCESVTSYEPAVRVLAKYGGWERNQVYHPFVLYDASAGDYKMWYAGSGGPEYNESAWSQVATGMVTSTNSISWVRRDDKYEPVLYARIFYEGDLIDPEENAGIFDSIWAYGASVIKDGSTCKMWYTGWGGETEHIGGGLENKINFRVGYATSTDGIEWTKYSGTAGAGSVLGLGSPGEYDAKGAGHPHVLKEGATYRMWYEAFDGSTWRILYATSSDGVNWTKQGLALAPGGSGALDEIGARNPVVIDRNGTYELWYQGRSTAAPNYHILRATSPDGLGWTKVPGAAVMLPDDPVDGDEKIHVDSIIVQVDDSLWVFFAKEDTTAVQATYGVVYNKTYAIHRQEMDP